MLGTVHLIFRGGGIRVFCPGREFFFRTKSEQDNFFFTGPFATNTHSIQVFATTANCIVNLTLFTCRFSSQKKILDFDVSNMPMSELWVLLLETDYFFHSAIEQDYC